MGCVKELLLLKLPIKEQSQKLTVCTGSLGMNIRRLDPGAGGDGTDYGGDSADMTQHGNPPGK